MDMEKTNPKETKENYMDDFDENPIIDNDISEVLKDLKVTADYSVKRHYYGDGHHKVSFEGTGFRDDLELRASEFREDFKEEFKECVSKAIERKKIDFQDSENVDSGQVEEEAQRIYRTWDKERLIDEVLTTRELAYMLHKKGIQLNKLKDQKPDNLLSSHSGAAAIYGGSGGVMESALRTAKYMLSPKSRFQALEFKAVRGLKGIKEASYRIANKTLKVAVVSGLKNAQSLLDHLDNYHYIEVMACPGGCIGGGGQPIPTTEEIREKRRQALYRIDSQKKLREAHKNKEAIEMIKWLEKEKIDHKILHTKYTRKFS